MTNDAIAAAPGLRRVFLHGFVLPARIGWYEHERAAPQRIRLDLDLLVPDTGAAARARGEESLDAVVDYGAIRDGVAALVAAEPRLLVETLAERIAAFCLGADARIQMVRVELGKPDVFEDVALAGVEIVRERPAGGA